jgi:hypothetical protein
MWRAAKLDGLLDGERPVFRAILLGQRQPPGHLTRPQLPGGVPFQQDYAIRRALALI